MRQIPVAPSPLRPGYHGPGATYSRRSYPGLGGVLREMKKLIERYRANPWIRSEALRITETIPADPRTGLADRRNADAIAQRLYTWINHRIAYTWDPVNVEWLQSPDVTLRNRAGDCDDHTILAASLLEAIGIRTRLVVIKANPSAPHKYTHVYIEYQSKGIWRPFDTTLHSRAGVSVPANRILGKKNVSLNPYSVTAKKKRPCKN